MNNKISKLSAANLEIMNLIWEKGELTVNEVHALLNAKRKKEVRRTTVQVQMKRLEDYGWLKHREQGRTFYYSPVREQEEARKDILRDIKNKVFGGSHAELVKYLFSDTNIPDEEIEQLRKIIDEYERSKK